MKYRNSVGVEFDEDDLYDEVVDSFKMDDFSNWVDDNYSGLDLGDLIILPSEALSVMGDFERAYEDTVEAIIDDRRGLYPDLSDLGITEIEDDDDEDEDWEGSESIRSAMSSAHAKSKTAVGRAKTRAKSGTASKPKVKTGNAPARAKARVKASKGASKASSASKRGCRR